MTNSEASKARAELWAKLKPLLIRSLGREGAADWLDHSAAVMRAEAKRERIETPLERAS